MFWYLNLGSCHFHPQFLLFLPNPMWSLLQKIISSQCFFSDLWTLYGLLITMLYAFSNMFFCNAQCFHNYHTCKFSWPTQRYFCLAELNSMHHRASLLFFELKGHPSLCQFLGFAQQHSSTLTPSPTSIVAKIG